MRFTMDELDEKFRSFSKGFVKDYMDLLAYRTSFQLSKEVFETTKHFPKEETYALDDRVQEDPAIDDFFSRLETE